MATNDLIDDDETRPGQERAYRLRDVRVLVVEDEPDTRELLAECLERIGAIVLALPSAEDALREFGDFAPDLVLSDLSLAAMDGAEMLRRMRLTKAGSQVPAMALSASTSHEDAGRAIEAGFDAHLAKPVSGDELVRAVASMLGTRHETPSR